VTLGIVGTLASQAQCHIGVWVQAPALPAAWVRGVTPNKL